MISYAISGNRGQHFDQTHPLPRKTQQVRLPETPKALCDRWHLPNFLTLTFWLLRIDPTGFCRRKGRKCYKMPYLASIMRGAICYEQRPLPTASLAGPSLLSDATGMSSAGSYPFQKLPTVRLMYLQNNTSVQA